MPLADLEIAEGVEVQAGAPAPSSRLSRSSNDRDLTTEIAEAAEARLSEDNQNFSTSVCSAVRRDWLICGRECSDSTPLVFTVCVSGPFQATLPVMKEVPMNHVPAATAIAPDQKVPIPGQIRYIIGNEGCARFRFYGMRNILTVFLVRRYACTCRRGIARLRRRTWSTPSSSAFTFLPLLEMAFGISRSRLAISGCTS